MFTRKVTPLLTSQEKTKNELYKFQEQYALLSTIRWQQGSCSRALGLKSQKQSKKTKGKCY